jgi:hypothetical protein
VDWGEGRVLSVRDAADGGGHCDACESDFERGLVTGIALKKYGRENEQLISVCESCFEDVTSDMGVAAAPGAKFLVLTDLSYISAL